MTQVEISPPGQEFQSRTWYADNAGTAHEIPPLQGERSAEVAVVGGGLAGVNIALGLAERGVTDVAMLEARTLGYGASGRNGGFVFGGYSLDPRTLVRRIGREQARRMYAWTVDAVALIRRRARQWNIDCRLTEGGVLWADWFDDEARLLEVRDWLADHLDVHWEHLPRERLRQRVKSPRYGGGLLERDAFHFHPLAYLRGIADRARGLGVEFYEQTPVHAIERCSSGWRLRTPDGQLRCDRVVMATGGYGPRLPVTRCVLPIATYVTVTAPLGDRAGEVLDAPWAVYDTRFAFDYYRLLPDTRLLWGGRISVFEPDVQKLKRLLRRDMLKVFPQLRDIAIEYVWSGRMSYARHQMPVLTQTEPGLWLATGFGGHGMAPTTLAGEVMAEALTGNPDRLEAFARWPAVPAYGNLGRCAAQLTYWIKQTLDTMRAWNRFS